MPNRKKNRGDAREVEISKNLSYLLRHGAKSEGIQLDEAGWANAAHVLNWRRIASKKVGLNELQSIVASNDKKRYQLEPNPAGDLHQPSTSTSTTSISDPARWRIRATQGHSITSVSSEQIFRPILLTDADCPDFVVHGTDIGSWKEIEKSGGLKPMRRKHIHFATKAPEKLPPLNKDFQSQSKPKEPQVDAVISGMRTSSTVHVWVDLKKSLKGGVKWWRSENGVILTEGVGEPKMLGLEWFKWVELRGLRTLYGERMESEGVKELESGMDRLAAELRDREEVSPDKVGGGKASQETKNGQKILQESEANGNEKRERAAVVKDSWND